LREQKGDADCLMNIKQSVDSCRRLRRTGRRIKKEKERER
jgi:hypothetical protein